MSLSPGLYTIFSAGATLPNNVNYTMYVSADNSGKLQFLDLWLSNFFSDILVFNFFTVIGMTNSPGVVSLHWINADSDSLPWWSLTAFQYCSGIFNSLMVCGRYGIRMPTFFSDIISHLILLLSWLSKTKSYGTLRPQALHQMDPATRKFSYISKKFRITLLTRPFS